MHGTKRKVTLALGGIVVAVVLLTGVASADEIEDSINEALQQYKNGAFSEAMTTLNYAAQLIGQKKGGKLESFLPEPLAGWSAEEASSQAAGAAAFGGGVTAERRYTRDGASVSVKIVTDSPMLQGMMMFLSNPMFATADGGKLEKISGQKAIVKYDAANKDGNISMVVDNRMLVTFEGNGASLEELKKYAAGIDYKKMAELP